LQSEKFPDKFYTGITVDLQSRLIKHNQGQVTSTKKYKPWKIKNAIAFQDHDKANNFEKYLKTGSGRTFSIRHF